MTFIRTAGSYPVPTPKALKRVWAALENVKPNEHEVDRLEAQADEHEAAKESDR